MVRCEPEGRASNHAQGPSYVILYFARNAAILSFACAISSIASASDRPRSTSVSAAMREIAASKPQTLDELGTVQGVGAVKLERYGQAMLLALSSHG